jgi:GH35 family endo-1,4-beta-xylanase
MPGDYTYTSFKTAEAEFPEYVKLNINDYNVSEAYRDQVVNLLNRGCKIDILGSQMHLFKPQQCLDIADGAEIQTPSQVYEVMDRLGSTGLPIHLSEITITAPNNDERGQKIQAIIARNLYRLWFSIEPMMGITWWNVVDDCGAPGEPSVSGLFNRDMTPKPAYFVMNDLINKEWKTVLSLRPNSNGDIRFRGFKGTYRISYTNVGGELKTIDYVLK